MSFHGHAVRQEILNTGQFAAKGRLQSSALQQHHAAMSYELKC